MALSGSFRINSGVSYLWLQVNWSATQNVAGNYSTVKADVYIQKSGSASPWNATNNTLLINIDGNRSERAATFDLRNQSSQLIGSHSARVNHDAAGNKNFSLGVNFPTGISAGTINGTQIFGLNRIPRAYTFITNRADYTFDSAMTVFINANGSGFRADLEMLFGNKLVTLQTNCPIGTNFFPIPKGSDFASQISNNVSGVGLLRVVTYNGSTRIGATEKTNITFSLPNTSAYSPTITGVSVADQDPTVPTIMGSNSLFVDGRSIVRFNVGNSIAYGSTIKEFKFEIAGQTFTDKTSTYDLFLSRYSVGTGSVPAKVTITDTRGRSSSTTINLNIQAYSPPKLVNFDVSRVNNGTTITLTKTASVSSLKNGTTEKNTYTIVTKYKKSSDTAWTTAKTETNTSANFNLTGFATDASYDFLVTVTDQLSSISVEGSVSTAQVLLDLYRDIGVGIGKMYETGHGVLDVGGDLWVGGNVNSYGFIATEIIANANLNDIKTVGFFYCKSNATASTILNTPMPRAFSLLVETHAGYKQTFTTYDAESPYVFVRNFYGTAWGPWYCINSPMIIREFPVGYGVTVTARRKENLVQIDFGANQTGTGTGTNSGQIYTLSETIPLGFRPANASAFLSPDVVVAGTIQHLKRVIYSFYPNGTIQRRNYDVNSQPLQFVGTFQYYTEDVFP